ncbi:MAG: APC family permease [Actinobacteria bacterium]|nr:APC family permease [Actinomycetota bacterium]
MSELAPPSSEAEQPVIGDHHPHHLRRSVGVFTATATSAGLAFAAINFLGIVSVSTFALGSSAWLAILIGGLIALVVAGVFSELNSMWPTAAGVRLYISNAFGGRFALIATFTYMTTVVLVIAADAFLIGAAIQHVLNEPPALAYVWILVLLAIATALNLRGITMAGRVQSAVTYTVLAGTVVLSIVAIAKPGMPIESPFALFGNGALSGFQAIAFALFLFAAFEWVTTTAEEARTPRVITRGLFIAPMLIWFAATVFSLALDHLVPKDVAHGSAYPQLLLGAAALGRVGEIWMLGVTVLTAINTFNGGFLVASRFVYAAAREDNLPRPFARLNIRAVPWLAVVVLAVTSAVVGAVIFATGQWLLLVAVGAALEASVFAIASAALLKLRRTHTKPRSFRLRAAPVLAGGGTVLFAGLALASGFSDPADPTQFSAAPALVVICLGLVATAYVLIVVPRLRRAAAARRVAARASGERVKRRPERPTA